jgi:hypothetical protein
MKCNAARIAVKGTVEISRSYQRTFEPCQSINQHNDGFVSPASYSLLTSFDRYVMTKWFSWSARSPERWMTSRVDSLSLVSYQSSTLVGFVLLVILKLLTFSARKWWGKMHFRLFGVRWVLTAERKRRRRSISGLRCVEYVCRPFSLFVFLASKLPKVIGMNDFGRELSENGGQK